MADRKRRLLSAPAASAPPAKKRAMASLSPLEQMDMKLLLQQNKSLAGSLKQYRRDVAALEGTVAKMEVERARSRDTIGTLQRAWAQMVEDLQKMVPADAAAPSSGEATAFLAELLAVRTSAQQSDVDAAVAKQVNEGHALVRRVAGAHEALAERLDSVMLAVKNATAAPDALKGEMATLAAETTRLTAEVRALKSKCRAAEVAQKKMEDATASHDAQVAEWREAVADAQEKQARAQKRADKLQTALDEGASSEKPPGSSNSSSSVGGGSGSGSGGAGSSSGGPAAPQGGDRNTLAELEQYKTLVKARDLQLAEMKRTQERLMEEVGAAQAQQRATMLSDDVVEVHPLYVSLKKEFDAALEHWKADVVRARDEFKSDREQTEQDMGKWHVERKEYESRMEKTVRDSQEQCRKMEGRMEELQVKLKKVEAFARNPSTRGDEVDNMLSVLRDDITRYKGKVEQLEKIKERYDAQTKEHVELAARAQILEEQVRAVGGAAAEGDVSQLRAELKACQGKLERVQQQVTAQSEENEALVSEMEMISKEFEDVQEQNVRLLQQLSDKENTTTQLISQKIKADQVQTLLRKQVQTVRAALDTAKKQAEVLKEAHDKAKAALAATEEEKKHLAAQLQTLGELNETLQRTARQATQAQREFENRLKSVTAAEEDLIKQATTAKKEAQDAKFACKKAEADVAALEKRVGRLQDGRGDEMMEEEMMGLKKRIRCSVCNDRWKDTVVTKCFHLFCRQCIMSNLQVRNRKCPTCHTSFDKGDVKSVWF